MKNLVLSGLLVLAVQITEASVVKTSRLTVSISNEIDSVCKMDFPLYCIQGDRKFEKMNNEVIDFFGRNILRFNDTSITDSLIMPVLFYKSLLFNTWEDKTRRSLYCNTAFRNLFLIWFLSGKTEEIKRIYLLMDPDEANLSFINFPPVKRIRNKRKANRYYFN